MTLWKDPAPLPIPDFLRDEHPLVARALVRRGVTTPEAARAFLDPSACPPAPPEDLPGLAQAANLVERAIRAGRTILVWGDFDVDGQTATAVLYATLKDLGADARYHIPVRARESHGVRPEVLAGYLDQGVQLVLTCDTGVSAHEAVALASARGVDFVITDHHDLPDELPPAAAIANPKFLPADHPLAALPGVGVACKLAEALYARFGRAGESEKHLDLAALGIVADLALLTGETRCLLQRGLRLLREGHRPGLRLLCEAARLDPARLTESQISFALGPRLNALGRLADAAPAVELFTATDAVRLQVIVGQIESLNAQRRLLTSQVYASAEGQLREDPTLLRHTALVLSNPLWPAGVVGIVANKLAERYGRPTVLLSAPPGEAARGSARSVEGVHITSAIAAQADLLLGFGGHPMAAGLSLEADKIEEFRRRLSKAIEAQRGEILPAEPELEIEAWLEPAEITPALAAQLERLAPYGPGNPPLTLAARGLTLQKQAAIGRGEEHLKLTLADSRGNRLEALWWDGAADPRADELEEGARMDLAFHLSAGEFRGRPQLTLELVDFRLTPEQPAAIRPERIAFVDWRAEADFAARMRELPAGAQVWVEGEDRQTVAGRSRYELTRAAQLVLYTAPPGPRELRAALQAVRPKEVYLICRPPVAQSAEDFLTRLAGLAKFAIARRGGQAEVSALTAACAQREVTVEIGLHWLAASGVLQVEIEQSVAKLHPGDGQARPEAQRELYPALVALLAESAAYREHIRRAAPEGWLRT